MKSLTRSTRTRLGVAQLEARDVPAAVPTVSEQLFLERLNDARANPAAYGQSVGVDLSYIAPSAPLAFDTNLIGETRAHSQDMNDRAYFSHTGSDGSSPFQRMTASGYAWNTAAESIAAGQSSPETALSALIIDTGVANLGHRNHLLANGSGYQHREVGVGIVLGGSGPYHNYYTIDSGANADTRPYVTGVVFRDANANGKYDAGEGVGGATVSVPGQPAVTTWSTGGYSLRVSPGAYTVTVSGGLATTSRAVTVGGANVRANFTPAAVSGPEVEVYDGGTNILDGTGAVDFGSVFVGDGPTHTFTVRNAGTAPLTLGTPGVPAGFRLAGGLGATTLAAGAETTFAVQLDPAATGTLAGRVSFATNDADENPFDFAVSGRAAAAVVIDDGDAGFATSGAWATITPYGYQGDDRQRQGAGGTAAWTFTVSPGTYRASATWVPYTNRASAARFTVTSGAVALGGIAVNQRLAPDDRTADGAAWEDIGTFTVTGTGLTVNLDGGADGFAVADAVRLERVAASPPTVPPVSPPAVRVVDDGDAGFRAVGGGWSTITPYGFQGDDRQRPGADAGNYAEWAAADLAAGTYRVSATWVAYTNRAANAQFAVYAGGARAGGATLNQQVAPADRSADGVGWKDLGTFTVAAGSGGLAVRLDGGSGGYVVADAVRFERLS